MAKEKTGYSFRFDSDSQTVKWLNAQENRTVSLDLLIKLASNKYGVGDLPTQLTELVSKHDTDK